MDKYKRKNLERFAKTLEVRFTVEFKRKSVKFDWNNEDHVKWWEAQRSQRKIGLPPTYISERYGVFKIVNHVNAMKAIYNAQGKKDVDLTKQIYEKHNTMLIKNFNTKFPGKYEELLNELRETIMSNKLSQANG